MVLSSIVWASALLAVAAAQPVPQPFPRPGGPPARPVEPPPPATPAVTTLPAPQTPALPDPEIPTEATLGIPIYPAAQYITSYDAGQGQRYVLFGSTASYEQLVQYYRNVLRERGNQVFDVPATYIFELGRFRQETMAFPPSVTLKDYTWGGLGGYLNPVPGGEPERFPTIIQIVAIPPDQRR